MMKQIIKNYLLAYPRLFKFAKFLRWLPSDAKLFVSVWSHRILHFREIIKADIVLSIGNHCQAAYYMDYYKLRKFSSPIDWMKYYSLDCVLEAYKNGFKNFFVNHYEDEVKALDNGNCRFVIDKDTGMIARHHFFKNSSLDLDFPKFYNKQIERFQRIDRFLKQAKNIVLVSCRQESIEELSDFLQKFQKQYNKKITLLNFKESKNIDYKKHFRISPSLDILEYCFDNVYPLKKNEKNAPIWIGNYKKWGGYEACEII